MQDSVRTPHRFPMAVTLGIVLVLTIPGAAHAAEEAPGGSLCDAITVEELDALGPLKYDAAAGGGPDYCVFEAAGDGSHSLTLAISSISYDLMKTPDGVEYDVGGLPASVLEDSLLVDIGEGIFAVTPTFEGSPDAAGLDVIEYALAVAGLAAPALETTVPAGEPADALQPPEVEGIEWGRVDAQTAAEFIEADESQEGLWQPLADALGIGTGDLLIMTVNARDAESEDFIGAYSLIEATGAEGEQLRSALVDWLLMTGGEGATVEDISLGGKDVTTLSVAGEVRGYVYVVGNIAHAVPGPEDIAVRFLEALP